jgi:hypothetical protein
VLNKRGLHGMHLVGRTETFDGRDLRVLLHGRQQQTAVGASAINVYRAGSALAVVTPLLCAGKMQRFTQRIEYGCTWVDLKPMHLSVYLQRDPTVPGVGWVSVGADGVASSVTAADTGPAMLATAVTTLIVPARENKARRLSLSRAVIG